MCRKQYNSSFFFLWEAIAAGIGTENSTTTFLLTDRRETATLADLGEVIHGEDVGQRGLPPVAPGPAVDGHTVLPLVRQQDARVVAVLAGVEVAVSAAGVRTPAVVGHHRVPV